MESILGIRYRLDLPYYPGMNRAIKLNRNQCESEIVASQITGYSLYFIDINSQAL